MKTRLFPLLLGGLVTLLLATACAGAGGDGGSDSGSAPPPPLIYTPSASPDPGRVPTAAPSPSPANATPSPTPPPSPTSAPTACPLDMCAQVGHFLLARPIAPPGRDWVDPTYRYGSTQQGAREPHHGVEFVNSSGTPVLAAADGQVVVAGDDSQQVYAEWPGFYGNLVILRHAFPTLEQPLYTLYAHLSQVSVQVGDQVRQGQEIGRVGLSGVATGSHLHFEVRLGENSYANTRNPELWLVPRLDPSGLPYATLAGRIEDGAGRPLQVPNLVIERLPGPGQDPLWQLYLETYAGEEIAGDDLWGENFVAGDLPAGWYRLTFVARGLQTREVQLFPGQVTVVRFHLDT